MAHQITVRLFASELGAALNLPLIGPDLLLEAVSSASDVQAGALFFNKSPLQDELQVPALAITASDSKRGVASVLVSENPRLDFARALHWIKGMGGVGLPRTEPIIGTGVQIGQFVTLGSGVMIGADSLIHNNVVIGDGVRVGARCVIKSGAVIGEEGFGFERDELGRPIRLIHLGSVLIGDDVEIGSLTTVCRGTLDDTVIEDFAKIDDHVHIAHNVRVGRSALITACAEVSGGAVIGDEAWLGPNVSVIQKVRIGGKSLVGIGSNVIRDVPLGATVAGNPAKVLKS